MFSGNLTSLVEEFWDKDGKKFVLKLDDEIIKGCLHHPQRARSAIRTSRARLAKA